MVAWIRTRTLDALTIAAHAVRNGASCRIWAILSDLAFHSVTPPNEGVANKNRTAFTRENMRFMPAEFNTILQQFFSISHKAFGVHSGVQNGVHFRVVGKTPAAFNV